MQPDQLQHGRDCYLRRAWSGAYEALTRADEVTPLPADDLALLATAAYLVGRDPEFQQLHERLHRLHAEHDDRPAAARCAFWLALTLLFRGEQGQANAWIARAQRLIEKLDCVEHGYVLTLLTEQQLQNGAGDRAQATAAAAIAIGERFADRDLVSIAQHLQGRALIQQGQVLAGLGRLDEAMLCVIAGDVSPIVTGLLYCSVLIACRQVHALGRAQEWTAAFSRACEQQPEMVAFTDTCLVHRAEIMQLRGEWPDALAETTRACERCQQADRKPPGAALYQRGEIHRLRGEFAEADEAFRAASEHGFEPQPGLALLRLAQGRSDSARAMLARLLSATSDTFRRAGLLPAQLDIMIATGDVPGARQAWEELNRLAELLDTDMLRAAVAQANGAIALEDGDAASALEPLHRAFSIWSRLDAPFEAARARVLVGRACLLLGDEEAARLEWTAARATFERLGARPELAQLEAISASGGARRENPLTARELQVLRLISVGHTNKVIAAQLRLSDRTIDRHVGNILRKLDVPSRTAAITYAYDNKLF